MTALTFLFAFANMPMLLRHGLQVEQAKEEPPLPPTGIRRMAGHLDFET